MNASAALSVEHGYATVRLTGDLDLAARPLLDSVAAWVTPHGDRPGLLLDLTCVDFVDVSSIRSLAELVFHSAEDPTLTVCSPGVVPAALTVSGYDHRNRVVQVGLPRGDRLRRTELRLLMRRMPVEVSAPAAP